ncbi:MAG TPA: malate synthase G [Solirubrobacteraceae bacterium]|nr:malate synthase G [Solirubrobacteraceae bacterium]
MTPSPPSRTTIHGLSVADALISFVRERALPGTGVAEDDFWAGLAGAITELTPQLRALLVRRDELQARLDAPEAREPSADPAAARAFLEEIGYLEPDPGPVRISTENVDPEVATLAGPQLVVPLLNARFATNAANARWGSLYDALYGSDVIDEADGKSRSGPYNPTRGAAVIARAKAFLDEHFPLQGASHATATAYRVRDGQLSVEGPDGVSALTDAAQFVAFTGDEREPDSVLLGHHGLHVEIVIDPAHPVGAGDPAHVADVVIEAALTAIMDLEDSVAAVDTADKLLGYGNWLGLIQGTLTAEVSKDGQTFTRVMQPPRQFRRPDGSTLELPGRALLFIRQVGHHMFSDMVLDADGEAVPEGILDAFVCGLASVHDLRGERAGQNSRAGSIYVVKPKMHGPAEVGLTVEILARVEATLGLAPATIKLGIMDEERRTSVNLKACIAAAADRVVFINTGFLDRTGDEIHTAMRLGPVVRKGAMKTQAWLSAYEDRNVAIGLACGFRGRAQIGKGMWAAPDNLAEMLEAKIAHPRSGASCAWVPSPTAATLHALHYHAVDVAARQRELEAAPGPERLEDLLTVPLVDPASVSPPEREEELDLNVQSTLGYVVRWIDQGVGCSKVPDLAGTPLMEDRATCRISSQMVSNWLVHGLVGLEQVDASLRRMAAVVDAQNAGDPAYVPMAPACDGQAFLAARELLTQGMHQPSGYTEPILHRRRVARKAELMETD